MVGLITINLFHILFITFTSVVFYLVIDRYFQTLQTKAQQDVQLFTAFELQNYAGQESHLLYLAILGHVFDVSSSKHLYGPGKPYHFFTGRDASKSFITGNTQDVEELNDVALLSDVELSEILRWKRFYEEKYEYRGKVIGRYFNINGQETEFHKTIIARVENTIKPTQYASQFPSCNVAWKKESGTHVWCTSRSGDGRERQWIGRPRQIVKQSNNVITQICACIPEDLTDKGYQPFPGCDETSASCTIADEK